MGGGTFLTPVEAHAFGAGEILNDVWDYPKRSLSEVDSWFGDVGYKPEVVLAAKKVRDLTGAPAIERMPDNPPDLKTKLDSTGDILDGLYLDYQMVATEVVLMGLKWDDLTVSEITQSIDKLNGTLETYEKMGWLTKSWGWPELDMVLAKSNSIKSDLGLVKSIVNISGMQPVAYERIRQAAKNSELVVDLLGKKTDTKRTESVFAKYYQVLDEAGAWDEIERAQGVINQDRLRKLVTTVNKIHGTEGVLDLKTLILANKQLLARDKGEAFAITWMEESPLRVKTVVINPSALSRQSVEVRYYLPIEMGEADVLEHDPDLQIEFDQEKKQYMALGNLPVAAGDARVVEVAIRDLWQFDWVGVDSLRSQANELAKVTVNSPRYVKAVELNSEIEAILLSVGKVDGQTLAPEDRIQAFRESQLKLAEVEDKLLALRQLAGKRDFGGWGTWGFLAGGTLLVGAGVKRRAWIKTFIRTRPSRPRVASKFEVFSGEIASGDL